MVWLRLAVACLALGLASAAAAEPPAPPAAPDWVKHFKAPLLDKALPDLLNDGWVLVAITEGAGGLNVGIKKGDKTALCRISPEGQPKPADKQLPYSSVCLGLN